jgi:hypothetical protein
MKRLILIPSILAMLAITGAFPIVFSTHSASFNGSFSGTFTITSTTPTTKATITATGNYEHLGKTTVLGKATMTGASECGGFTATEQETFTAGNGDQIFATAIDVACPTSNPNVIHVTASSTITGGTGRFADASGSFTTQVSAVAASPTATTGTLSGTSTGTITY